MLERESEEDWEREWWKRVLSRSVSEPECSGSSTPFPAGKGDLSLEDAVERRERGVEENEDVGLWLGVVKGDRSGVDVFDVAAGAGEFRGEEVRTPLVNLSSMMRLRSVRLLARWRADMLSEEVVLVVESLRTAS